jgi:hypothetical protein
VWCSFREAAVSDEAAYVEEFIDHLMWGVKPPPANRRAALLAALQCGYVKQTWPGLQPRLTRSGHRVLGKLRAGIIRPPAEPSAPAAYPMPAPRHDATARRRVVFVDARSRP